MKRKNKPIRRPDAVQPLPLPADAGEIAFAHGVSRRVVVVDAAESPLFEQIIYIVRDDAASGGVTAADLVQQARDAVGHVPAAPTPRPRQKSYTGLLIWLCSVAGVPASGVRPRAGWGRPSDTACTAAGDGTNLLRPGGICILRVVFCGKTGCQRLTKVLE